MVVGSFLVAGRGGAGRGGTVPGDESGNSPADRTGGRQGGGRVGAGRDKDGVGRGGEERVDEMTAAAAPSFCRSHFCPSGSLQPAERSFSPPLSSFLQFLLLPLSLLFPSPPSEAQGVPGLPPRSASLNR